MIRHGYYVEGKFFANRFAQAEAAAQFRATQFGRPVELKYLSPQGEVMKTWTYEPGQKQLSVA